MNYQFLCDSEENLEKKINLFLDFQQFSWDKIYIFSAFVSDYGVKKVKEIISHESLNENTEVVIAIGKKTYDINKPINIQKILDFIKKQNQNKFKTKPIRFICPKNDGFHIKAYCFLGRNKEGSQTQIGYSIVGSSNLTQFGFKGKGELCISIDNLELTQKLIDCLSNIYIDERYYWDKEIENYKIQYEKHQEKKYKDKQSRQDQDEVLRLSQENSTPVNQAEPRPNGKFIELGVLTDSVLLAKATNLANDSDKIYSFHSSPKTLEQAKKDFFQGSLCLLLTENKEYQIVEIMPYLSDQENTKGCFVRYRENVTYELSNDIREILANEKYKIISDPKDMQELPYDTLNDFEKEVKMLHDPNYKKGLEKGKEKMQSEIYRLLEEIEEINLIPLKKKLKEIRELI